MKMAVLRSAIRGCLVLCVAIPICQAAAQKTPGESLLVVVGDPMPQVRVGHEQHCSAMTEVDQGAAPRKDRLDVILTAGQPTWISLTGQVDGKTCESLASLVPDADGGYIARLGKHNCTTEIYQTKKGEAPVLKKAGNESSFSNLLCATAADSSGEPRMATDGDETRILIGQDGFCGKMRDLKGEEKSGLVMKGEVRNWVRFIYHPTARRECEFNFSYIPKAGNAYLVRSDMNYRACLVKLFHLLPDGTISPETMTPENDRSCLFQ